jgi:uncharacterized membrane protein
VNPTDPNSSPAGYRGPDRRRTRPRANFSDDFRRFFLRGLSALLPTIITLWLLIWIWSFLWENLGQHMISAIIMLWNFLAEKGLMEFQPLVYMRRYWWSGDVLPMWLVQLIGVGLSIVLIYVVGLLVGNLIGRTIWRLAEVAVMRIPLVRAVYPAVKQVTDFVLAERNAQFESSQVVAVQPHAGGIWSIGLVTGAGLRALSDAVGGEMVTVFIPSSPTAFSGYVVVVPREAVVELPLKVDEAMRLLISGGVITPGKVPASPGSTVGPGAGVPAVAVPELQPVPAVRSRPGTPGSIVSDAPAAARLVNE